MKKTRVATVAALLGIGAILAGCAGAQPGSGVAESQQIGTLGAATVGGMGTASTGGSGLPARSVSGGTGTGVGTQSGSELSTTTGSGNGTAGTFTTAPGLAR